MYSCVYSCVQLFLMACRDNNFLQSKYRYSVLCGQSQRGSFCLLCFYELSLLSMIFVMTVLLLLV